MFGFKKKEINKVEELEKSKDHKEPVFYVKARQLIELRSSDFKECVEYIRMKDLVVNPSVMIDPITLEIKVRESDKVLEFKYDGIYQLSFVDLFDRFLLRSVRNALIEEGTFIKKYKDAIKIASDVALGYSYMLKNEKKCYVGYLGRLYKMDIFRFLDFDESLKSKGLTPRYSFTVSRYELDKELDHLNFYSKQMDFDECLLEYIMEK